MSQPSLTDHLRTPVSVNYEPRTRPFRNYLTVYGIAMLGIGLLWGGVNGILLTFQVQQIEFAHIFTGANAGVDLQQLADLTSQVDAHLVIPTAGQKHLLALLAQYNTAKAGSLSLATSVGVFIAMLIQPILGTLSDHTRSRWGRRAPWIAAGAVAGGALVALMPLAPTVAVLVILWSVAQLVTNVAQGPLGTTVADRVPSERIGSVSMLTGAIAYGGAIVGMLLAGWLFRLMGLGGYVPLAIITAVPAIVFVLIARDKSSKDLAVSGLRLSVVLLSFVAGLRDRDYRWAWIAKVLLWTGYGMSTVYGVYLLEDYVSPALSANQAATVAPLLPLAGCPAALLAMVVSGHWSDKIRRRKPFVIAASVIMAASFVVPFVWPSVPAMFIQSIVVAFGFGMFLVIDQALFIEVLPDRAAAGRDLGLSALGTNLGQAIAPAIAGVVVAVSAGSYRSLWPVACVIVLVSAVAILPIRRVR